ncbi:hypothetical protein PMAYCL1PPCAC_08331, partial [Pristionchus mayeri]
DNTFSSDTSASQLKLQSDMDELSDRPSVTGIQHNEGIESPSDLSNWGILPSKARPAFELLCSYLRTDYECLDLSNFFQVSSQFRSLVMEFLHKKKNRPAFHSVRLKNSKAGLRVVIFLLPINLPFYDVSHLDWGRFKRSMGQHNDIPEGEVPILRVTI